MKKLKKYILIKYKAILSYCLKCRKNTESINPRVLKTRNGKTIILSKCAICGSKKSKFIKKQEASGVLSSVGISFKSYKRWHNNIIKMCCMW